MTPGFQEEYILNLRQHIFSLMPQKAIYFAALKCLFIADPHFGKAAHFRKAGIPIPESLHLEDLFKIETLIRDVEPLDIYFLGDLFHSEINDSWLAMNELLAMFGHIKFHLIKGNHDVLPESIYRDSPWIVHHEPLILEDLILSHEPLEWVPDGKINLCGHIHPGISLRGVGRQHLVLPCFFVSAQRIILPAFGRFTGLAKMSCTDSDRAFVIANNKVIPII